MPLTLGAITPAVHALMFEGHGALTVSKHACRVLSRPLSAAAWKGAINVESSRVVGGWVSSDESNRRAGGRRRWLGVRRLRAKVRRHHLIRLCAAEGFSYGCRSRWAKALQVAPSTISSDLNIILRQHRPDQSSGTSGHRGVGHNRRRGKRERVMSARVTVRLPQDVRVELKRRARQQGQSLAAFIRHHLVAMVTQTAAGAAGQPQSSRRAHARCQ
jgi:hypothetical protein